MRGREMPEKIRTSLGSAVVLGLVKAMLGAKPTTIYLLTFHPSKCSANCGFCPQARKSRGRADMLSRVTWPVFQTQKVISEIVDAVKEDSIRRICIQALNYPTAFQDVLKVVQEIRSHVNALISVSCQPIDREEMRKLAEAGVERICIPLDTATEELFNKVKGRLADGPYEWKEQLEALKDGIDVFGRGAVSTHLIVGLGETEKEIVKTIQWCVDLGVYPSLFAFTPIPGTAFENNPQPPVSRYRRIQIAHHLITEEKTRYEKMLFDGEDTLIGAGVPTEQLWQVIRTGRPFLTSGCQGCNRPYYNESPRGPIYNYPQQPLPEEIAEIENQIQL
jgi:biotin synthase